LQPGNILINNGKEAADIIYELSELIKLKLNITRFYKVKYALASVRDSTPTVDRAKAWGSYEFDYISKERYVTI